MNLASPLCGQAIRESMYLLKRYEFMNFDDPEHISATCRLHIAKDHSNDGEKVALKFMTDYTQFRREIETRASMNLSSEYVMKVVECYNASTCPDYDKALRNRPVLSQYPYLLVMPAGTKTLHTGLYIN